MTKYEVKTSQESGRSMVEMLGVLAIIGVLSVGGIAGYSMAMSKFKITKAIDQVQTITTNIRTLYASQRSYTALTALNAFNLGVLTGETYDSATAKGRNPFDGEISFAATARTFSIKYEGLTTEACVKMATADWGADQSAGLVSIKLSGGAAAATYQWAVAPLLPVDLVAATTNCSGGAAGSVYAVEWTYR